MTLIRAKAGTLSLPERKKCKVAFFLQKQIVFLCTQETKIIYFCPIVLSFLHMSLTIMQDPTTVI